MNPNPLECKKVDKGDRCTETLAEILGRMPSTDIEKKKKRKPRQGSRKKWFELG